MMKRIIPAVLALAMLLSLSVTAFAHDVPRERDDCSIEVQVRYDGEAVSGGTLTAIRVGYVDEDDGNYFFRRVFDDVLLEEIDSAQAARDLQTFYENNRYAYEFETQTVAVNQGVARFENLQTGLYLIVQRTAAPGFTAVGAFLVSIPYMVDGEYQYHVTAAIKSELERPTETVPTEPSTPTDPTETDPTKPTEPENPKLPQTGQLNWPVPVLTVLGMGLVILGFGLRLRKKENYES